MCLTREVHIRDAILETAVPRLHIVPSTMDLSGFELEIAHERDRAWLRDALTHLNGGADEVQYTYVLVDCPPSLNLVTVNAMAAAHSILVPLQCEFFALEACRNCSRRSSRCAPRSIRISPSTASC